MFKPGHCYGCFSNGDYCPYVVHNNETEGLCPCVTCIVKPMCNKICYDFCDWTDTEEAEEAMKESYRLDDESRLYN
jgi:hypothetical protein